MKIIGSAYEHDAIFEHLDMYVHDIGELFRVLQMWKDEPKVVFWMMTNNMTGTIFNVEEIGKLCHKYNAYYIMDCTASIGHNSLGNNIEKYCDCIITSAHKYHGPSGMGCMWISDKFADFLGMTKASKDNFGLTHGTPNVSGAVAMSYAMKHAIEWEKDFVKNYYLRLLNYLEKQLNKAEIYHNYVDGYNGNYTAAINAIILHGINADALATFLSSKGIYIGVGHSACSDEADYRVLEAFGLSRQEASETVRISFCEDTSLKEIDAFVEGVKEFKKKFM